MKNNNLGTSISSSQELQYQTLHRNDNEGPTLSIIATTLVAATAVAVVLRLITRRIIKRPLDVDDFAIIVALVSDCYELGVA